MKNKSHLDLCKNLFAIFKIKIIKISILLSLIGFSCATIGLSFLKIPTVMSDTISSETHFTFYNPACLMNERLVSLTHAHWFVNTKLSAIYFSHPFKGSSLGIGFMQLNYGKLTKRDKEAKMLGDFQVEDKAFILSYGFPIKNIPLGLNLKFAQQNIDNHNSFGTFLDLGIINQPYKNIILGFTIQNIGIHTTNRPPITSTFGISHKSIPMILDMRFYPYNNKFEIRLKLKVDLFEKASLGLAYTAGIFERKQTNITNFSLCIKPIFKERLSLQYTFSHRPFLGQIHLFSINFKIR